MGKWQEFHKKDTSKDLTQLNQGDSNVRLDLLREMNEENRMTINGVPFNEIAAKYGNFAKDEDATRFFSEQLLCDVEVLAEERDRMINFLSSTFHQGGLRNPVTATLSTALWEEGTDDTPEGPVATFNGDMVTDNTINIVTTPQGFKIQETITVNEMFVMPGRKFESLVEDISEPLQPDVGNKYIIQAHATLDIDFSENAKEPTITVDDSAMKFGNKNVAKALDQRSFFEWISDLFQQLMGKGPKKAELITPNTPDETPTAAP